LVFRIGSNRDNPVSGFVARHCVARAGYISVSLSIPFRGSSIQNLFCVNLELATHVPWPLVT